MVKEQQSNPFRNFLNVKEINVTDGTAELRIDLFPDLFNFSGSVHGGVLASLVDISIGSAIRSTLYENQQFSTVELKINYIKPAKGSFLVIKASLSHRGTTLGVGTSEIFNDQNQLVAIGTATFFIKQPAHSKD